MSNERKLVIVESPAKARTLTKILGSDYKIIASMGHVRDLPERSLGVDTKRNFEPKYITTKKGNTISSLIAAAKSADEILLATDPDREGEAIAWHLKEILSEKTKAHFSRIEFHEITKSAIQKAVNSPREIDSNLVNSQQARRILDRLVGYQISPLLWSSIKKNISAGRVQSVALRMVCEREKEIQAFVPKEYWILTGEFVHQQNLDNKYNGKLFKINEDKAEIKNAESAEKIYKQINASNDIYIENIKVEETKKHALPPFITSTLQQTAGNMLRFSAAKTMQIAQQLYEGIDLDGEEITGLITYMRTDSVALSQEAISDCRKFIERNFGQSYLPEKPNYYKSSSSSQGAHEAIRPTNVEKRPEDLEKFLNKDQLSLYRIIWQRFVACQMSDARLSKTTVDTMVKTSTNDKYSFRTVSMFVTFAGYTKILNDNDKNEEKDAFLKEFKNGNKCSLLNLEKEQKFTEPPPQYTEPTLIKELETNGIGRPSTYATIINTIQKRQYVKKEKGKLVPEELGFKVNEFLIHNLADLFNIGFTAEMENKLDEIEKGNETWTKMLEKFYNSLLKWIDLVKYKEAPEPNKIQPLISQIETISNWTPIEEQNKKIYDDKKFFTSIKKQFNEKHKLSKKQWDALLKIAIKYEQQIPNLEETAKNSGFLDDLHVEKTRLATRKQEIAIREKERGIQTKSLAQAMMLINNEGLDKMLGLNNIDQESYEKKFLTSIDKQIKAGKFLSEKQENLFVKIIVNHKDNISSYPSLVSILNINEDKIRVSENKTIEKAQEHNKQIEEMLLLLDKIEKWNEPETKKGKIFNDHSFFISLKEQFTKNKKLSYKQFGALKKLVIKYSKQP